MNRSRLTEAALVVTIGLFWGLNWPSVKFILGEIAPWTLRALGFILGAGLLALIAKAARQSLVPHRAERLRLLAAGLLTVFGFNVLSAFGQLVTETSTAAIIAFTMPMWAMAMSAIFLAEALTAPRVIALLVGMLGLLILVRDDLASFMRAPAGPVIMLGAAVSWAAGTVVLKSREWSIAPIARAAWMVAICAPITVVAAFVFERPLQQPLPSAAVLATLAYHIVFPMTVCHAAWVTLVGRLPASTAAIGTLLIPVVGVLSASVLLDESLSANKLLALLLVLSSIALSFAKGRPGLK